MGCGAELLSTAKETVTTHLATKNTATALVVSASKPDEIEIDAVGAVVSHITQSFPEITKEVRLIAALMSDDGTGNELLEAICKLCSAFSALHKTAKP